MADEVTRIEIVAEDKTGPGVASAKRNLTGLQSSLNNVSSGMGGISSAAAGASRSLLSLGSAAAVAGGTVAVMGLAKVAGGLIDMGRGALQSYAEFERLGMSLNALAAKEALLTGQASTMGEAMAMTSGKSKELLDWVQKLAIESPFRQEDISSAFRLSMALGFNTAEAQRLTEAMVDFSTATGAGGETIERVSRALGQMKTKGKLSAEEMLQLSEAGVDANAILMRAFDMTGPQLFDAMEKGAIDVNAAIEAIVSEMEKLYGGAGKNSAESMSGLLSSLSEIGEITSRDLLAGVFKAAQPYIANVVGLLTAPEFKAGIDNWSAKLGAFTTEGLESAAGTVERIGNVITPLLDAEAPPWMVALGVLFGGGEGGTVEVTPTLPPNFQPLQIPAVPNLKPPIGPVMDPINLPGKVTSVSPGTGMNPLDVQGHVFAAYSDPEKDYGIVVKATGNVTNTTIDLQNSETQKGGKLVIDSVAGITNFDWQAEGFGIHYDAAAKMFLVDFGIAKIDFGSGVWKEAWATWQSDFWGSMGRSGAAFMTAFRMGFASLPVTLQAYFNGFTIAAEWAGGELDKIKTQLQGYLTGFVVAAEWLATTGVSLRTALNEKLLEPFLVFADWGGNALGDLWDSVQGWFTAHPINIFAQAAVEYGTEHSGHGNHPRKPSPVYPTTSGDYMSQPQSTNWWDQTGNAAGTDFWKGGWTWVGEKGPELLNLPRGARILSNQDSKQMIGQLAEGTTDIPDWLERGLTALGLWVPQQQGPQYGPPTREEAYGTWRKIEQKGTEALQQTAKQAGDAFESAAQDTNDAFKSALQGVPGLFGTSQVTGDQMKMAELGVPQNFADDYLRRLSDEVLNGVDWEGVDITDAANRAGIDPNLPANVILELFKNAWNDSSLFANSANLDLINQDAVKTAIEQQQKELVGKTNIMQLFGITDENMQGQADALGQGLASVFGQAAGTDAMKAAGVQAFAAIGEGFGDSGTAVSAVGGMAQAVVTATGTPENQTALEDAGKAAAFAYYDGWKSFMAEAAPPPPTGSTGNTAPIGPSLPPAAPPGRAVGVGYWSGGWMTVHANETIYAPRGTSVQTARESAEAGGTVVNNYVTINRAIDEEAFLARMARRLQRGY